jgi:hypothetical protein
MIKLLIAVCAAMGAYVLAANFLPASARIQILGFGTPAWIALAVLLAALFLRGKK